MEDLATDVHHPDVKKRGRFPDRRGPVSKQDTALTSVEQKKLIRERLNVLPITTRAVGFAATLCYDIAHRDHSSESFTFVHL